MTRLRAVGRTAVWYAYAAALGATFSVVAEATRNILTHPH